MESENKYIRLMLHEEDGKTLFSPVLFEPDTAVWDAVARLVPPWVDLDSWVISDWKGNTKLREISGYAIRSGSWFYAGQPEGLTSAYWRDKVHACNGYNDLDIELYHRSLLGIRALEVFSLPAREYIQIRVVGDKIILLHEKGVSIGEKSENDIFEDIIVLEETPLSFVIDRDGRYLLLYRDRVDIIDPNYPKRKHTVFSVPDISRHKSSELTCLGYEMGEISLLNRRGELYRPQNPNNPDVALKQIDIQSASYCASNFLLFDGITKKLSAYFAPERAHSLIFTDTNGSANTFCMDDQDHIYYLNSSEGLKIFHREAGYIARMSKRRQYEPFVHPVSSCVEQDMLHVLDGDKVFVYQMEWERIEE